MSNEQNSPRVLVIELVNQQPSNFVLDASAGEESDLPTNISAPNARKIKNRSKVQFTSKEVIDGKEREITKLRPIRYIKGCDLIFVDEQDKAGYVPNPAADTIWILNGKLTVIEAGSDIGQYRYLRAFEGNVDNPDRPDNALDIFREINTEIEAVGTEDIFDSEIKVLKYMDSLKSRVGENQYEYQEDTLAFLCKLFKLPPYAGGYKSEAWVNLAMLGKADPKKFLNSIASMVAVFEADVNQGMAKGVIGVDDEKSFFVSNNMVITTFAPHTSSDERKDEIVEYFADPRNRKAYDNLRSELHLKTVKAAEVIE